MRRVAVLAVACIALLIVLVGPSVANAAFTQCPAVELDGSCQFLVTVTDAEKIVESDPALGPFDPGGDDTLIGIQNNSSKPLSSIAFSAEIELFGFEFDGICQMTKPAPGCKVLAKSTSGTVNPKAGGPCPPETEACGFEPEGGEPPGQKFPEGVSPVGELANGDPVSGYEGPTSYFTNIGPSGTFATGSGVVNFSPAVPVGGHTYFSLESPPVGGFGSASTLGTTLSGGGQSGASISVVQGTAVSDTATLSGTGATVATGPVSFNVYSDPACKTLAAAAGSPKLAGGSAGPSTAISSLGPGKYYWQAHYSGSLSAQAATSTCGSEVLTVLAPTTTTTIQSTGKALGASLAVPVGTAVSDQALIAGPLGKSATGTVSYVLYKDSKCTVPALAGSAAAVVAGVAGPSALVKPAVGTYYWRASYSGDALNAPSASACGSEVLRVAKKASLGLRSKKGCVSKRKFPIHPKGPRGVKLVSFEEFINGTLVKSGRLSNRQTSVNLVGLPKGTFEVELTSKSSKGDTYEDTRTFHTCVPKKHKKGKK
ncbi:MAG TPA: hypothetical protein VNY35_02190 [Solirubrobacteraceae bacterium]|nr:hypothetical protein [Solirubrobacteraceae bacterium]